MSLTTHPRSKVQNASAISVSIRLVAALRSHNRKIFQPCTHFDEQEGLTIQACGYVFFPVPFVFASLFPRSWSGWSGVLRHLPSCSHKSIGGSGCEKKQGQIQAIAPKLRTRSWRLVAPPQVQLHAGPRLRECFMRSAYTQGRCHSTPFSSQLKNISADAGRVASLGKKWPRNPFVF